MYEKGQGVKQDYAEALSWYLKSALQGNIKAKVCLAYLYVNGLGVKRDLAEALSLIRKATRETVQHKCSRR